MGARVVKEHYKFQQRHDSFGPYDAADLSATDFPLIFVAKRTRIDQLRVYIGTQGSAGATIQFFWFNPDQTPAAAAAANQWLTDTIAIGTTPDVTAPGWRDSEGDADGTNNTAGADTVFNMDSQTADAAVEIAPGGGIGFEAAGTFTAIADLIVGVSYGEAMQ